MYIYITLLQKSITKFVFCFCSDTFRLPESPLVNLPLPVGLHERLTGSAAVAADVVARHAFDLAQDGFGQLLNDVVLTNVLVSFKGIVKRFLLTVLQHRDPAEPRQGGGKDTGRERESEDLDKG